jgi:hypothetical protein
MAPGRNSPCFIFGTLIAIALFATIASLVLQRMFGSHIALIAVGPLLAVLGVLFFCVRVADRDW